VERAQPFPKRVMLLGGGRWGRVHADVLSRLLPSEGEIIWVSRFERANVIGAAARLSGPARVFVVDSIEAAREHGVDAAIVATATHTHADVARTLLAMGLATYVEKPIALNVSDASQLIELARSRGVVLGVGVELLLASYLHYFRSLFGARRVQAARIEWLEPIADTRYGEVKRLDLSTSRIHDVFPHLWSIIHVLLPAQELQLCKVQPLDRGAIRLELRAGDTATEARIDRRAAARRRHVELRFVDGGSAALDFSTEPGVITLDGQLRAKDPDWGRSLTPLPAAVSGFLRAVADPLRAREWPCLAEYVVGSVTGATAAAERLADCEADKLVRRICVLPDPSVDADVLTLLIDNLVPELAVRGMLISAPADQEAVAHYALATIAVKGAPEECTLPIQVRQAVEQSNFMGRVASVLPTASTSL
jgi:predicted dehydrogenase